LPGAKDEVLPSRGVKRLLPVALADAVLFALGIVAGFVRDFSGDFHWHLVLGDYTLTHGALMRSDVLSHTFAGKHQSIDYFLSDLALAAAYRVFGYPGCYLLRGLFLGALLVLLAREARKLGAGAWVALLLPAFVLSELLFRLYLRPETFTFTLLAGILSLLGHHERTGSHRALLLTLPVVTLWANIHGSVAIALAVLGIYCLVRAAPMLLSGGDERRNSRFLLALPVLAFVAATLNPEGLRQPLMFLHVTEADPTFSAGVEWRPLDLAGMSALFPVFVAVVVVTSALAGMKLSLWRALSVVLLFGLSLTHARFVKGALVCAVPLVAANLAAAWVRFAEHVEAPRFRLLSRALTGATTLGLLTFLFAYRELHREVGLGLDPGVYPEQACRFAREKKLPKEMLNSFDFGSYLLFCLPERRTYIDQRAATLFTPEFSREYRALVTNRDLLRNRVERYRVSFAFTAFDPLAQALATDPEHWSLVYFDDLAQLYVGSSHPEIPGAPPFRWLHPYALASLTLLEGPAKQAARKELAVQSRRCADCRQTRLVTAALAASEPNFERLVSPLAEKSENDLGFLLAVAAFRTRDFPTALALFEQHLERPLDHVAAMVWVRRTLSKLGRQVPPFDRRGLAVTPSFRAELEALRELDPTFAPRL